MLGQVSPTAGGLSGEIAGGGVGVGWKLCVAAQQQWKCVSKYPDTRTISLLKFYTNKGEAKLNML